MGPELPVKDWDRCWAADADWLDTELLGLLFALNGVMLCDTPSARMNCSRNSTLVRPFAAFCNFDFHLASRKKKGEETEKKTEKKREKMGKGKI